MHFASKAIIFSNNEYLLQLRDNKKIFFTQIIGHYLGEDLKNES